VNKPEQSANDGGIDLVLRRQNGSDRSLGMEGMTPDDYEVIGEKVSRRPAQRLGVVLIMCDR
jgi:hypothetical protein